jgi:hypothetical protein
VTTVDPEHAYQIVVRFLNNLWEELDRPEELGVFSSMCSYVPGRGTADPAMWYDWLAWARQVQTGELVPQNTGRRGSLTPADVGPLTPEEAYQAMFQFIEEYYLRISRPPELGDLLGRMRYTPGAGTADPEMWRRWLTALDKVRDA